MIYLIFVLDFWMFSIEVLLKFWQLVQVPSLLAETFPWIPKLHGRGATATTHGPKPRPEGQGSRDKQRLRVSKGGNSFTKMKYSIFLYACLCHDNNWLSTYIFLQLNPMPRLPCSCRPLLFLWFQEWKWFFHQVHKGAADTLYQTSTADASYAQFK